MPTALLAGDAAARSSRFDAQPSHAGHKTNDTNGTSCALGYPQNSTAQKPAGLQARPGPHAQDVGSRTSDQISSQSLRSIRNSLPPTPPSQDGIFEEPLMSPAMLSDIYQDAIPSPRLYVSTPVNLTGPPTPDNTPPSTRDRLRAPDEKEPLHSPPLSQAGSFITARETLRSHSSSRVQSRASFKDTPRMFRPTITPTSTTSEFGETISSTKMPDSVTRHNHLDSSTPDPSRSPEARSSCQTTLSGSPPRDMGVRDPSRPYTPSPATRRNNSLAITDEDSPKHRMRRRHHRRSSISNNLSSDAMGQQEGNDHSKSHDALYTHLRDEKSKRLSAHSGSSTVVEAIVYTSPKKPRRTLRHAGKNLALRKDAKVDISEMEGKATVQDHRLRHRNIPLPGRGPRMGHFASHRERFEVDEQDRRAEPLPEISTADAGIHSSNTKTEMPKFALRPLTKSPKCVNPPDWPLRLLGDRDANQGQSGGNRSHVEAEFHAQSPLDPESVGSPVKSPTDLVVNAYQDTARSGWRRAGADQELASPPLRVPYHHELLRPRFDSFDATDHDKPRPLRSHPGPDGNNSRPFLDGPRNGTSSDHHHLGPRSLSRTPLSDYSTWSDRTHTAVVDQARAVNRYPHHNESLLLVQHSALPQSGARVARSSGPNESPNSPGLQTFLSPATPPAPSSPLVNPRVAPAPPTINFIPASPMDEHDRQLKLTGPFATNATAPLPQRQTSLRDRARAQSVAIVDAIMLRTSSLKSNHRRRNTVGSGDKDRNLHPLWRPRGFWDDFDSDQEFADEAEHGVLPQGGDTSEVTQDGESEFPRKMSRRAPRRPVRRGEKTLRTLGGSLETLSKRRRYGVHSINGSVLGMSAGLGKGLKGLRGLGHLPRRLLEGREEKKREKRREQIRESIGRIWMQGEETQ